MEKARFYLFLFMCFSLFASCSQDDLFDVSSSGTLTFSLDTLSLDTVFSNTSTPTKTFWVYNTNKKGVQCRSIRLERGNQTGFQVNVDGIFLGSNSGYQTNEVEVRGQDSIRIYVKVLATETAQQDPQLLTDNLVFSFDDGKEQKINLRAWAWDATMLRNLVVSRDTVLSGSKPFVVYGGISISEGSSLTIAAGTNVYFHSDAGLEVKGKLFCRGTATNNVVLRGSRLDKLFENLPYDRVSGQWQGIRFATSSYENVLEYTDIRNAFTGIEIDSSDVSREKLLLNGVSIHNSLGNGLRATSANLRIMSSAITNAQSNCLAITGGRTFINGTTLAQFYPFSARRGVALWLDNRAENVTHFECINSLITGISADEMSILLAQREAVFLSFILKNNVMRTPRIENLRGAEIENVVYENPTDTINAGRKNFIQVDFTDMKFNFNLSKTALALDKADATTLPSHDRNGQERANRRDVGAYILKEQ